MLTSRLFPVWSMGFIPEKKIAKTFATISEVIADTLGDGMKPRAAMIQELKSFVSAGYLDKHK